MKWVVEDGKQFQHTVELTDDGQWLGTNNVAHIYNLEERIMMTNVLLKWMLKEPNGGMWSDFTWIPIR